MYIFSLSLSKHYFLHIAAMYFTQCKTNLILRCAQQYPAKANWFLCYKNFCYFLQNQWKNIKKKSVFLVLLQRISQSNIALVKSDSPAADASNTTLDSRSPKPSIKCLKGKCLKVFNAYENYTCLWCPFRK